MACRENQPANALRLGYDPLSRSKHTEPTIKNFYVDLNGIEMPRDQRLIVLVLPKLPHGLDKAVCHGGPCTKR
jgi:hypothetical protein